MTTIRQVAERAGVSVATVSRAFSHPDLLVPKTLKQVMAAVHALDYAPNMTAKSLRTARTGKILVTVPDIANPFFSQIIQGVEEAALAAGYAVLLGDTQDDPEREERYALMFRRKEADGLIFLGHRLPATVSDLVNDSKHSLPIVNGCEFSPELRVSSVHIDNRAAAIDVMAHLHMLGHRHIGIVTGPLVSPLSRERLEGVRTFAKSRGFVSKLQVTSGDFSIASGAAGAELLLGRSPAPTAIFCFSDEMAIGALAAARRSGIAVPAALSVVGFDDVRFASYATPALTTVRQPMADLGRETVRLLLAALTGNERQPVSVTLPHQLIARESTGPVSRC
jgi:LacI family repressor for deo operon, udp, cdd, tsx, nupC, and nupG